MHILHGSWRMGDYADPSNGFVLWAETSDLPTSTTTTPLSSLKRVKPHPFAASASALKRALLDRLPSVDGLVQVARESSAVVQLPSRKMPQASPGLVLNEPSAVRSKLKLAAWKVGALVISPQDVLGLLMALPSDDDTMPGVKVGADLRYWSMVGKLALDVLARQRFVPTLIRRDNRYLAVWQPLLDACAQDTLKGSDAAEQARLDRLAGAMPPSCRAILLDKDKRKPPAPRALFDSFMRVVIDAMARSSADFGRYEPIKHGTTADAWLEALWNESPVMDESDASLAAFYEKYRAWAELVPGVLGGDTFRICFRLDPPLMDEDEGIVEPQLKAQDWMLRYLLQATDDPSLLVPAGSVWQERGSTAKFLDRKFDAPQERLLAGLGQASRLFAPIEASLRSARPEGCALNVEQAYMFIRETSLLLQSFGFGVLVPGIGSKFGVRVGLRSKQKQPSQKGGVTSLTFESIVEYDWQLALGGEPLSRAEFDKLAALKVPLVQVRGQWVELRPEQIEQVVKYWEKRRPEGGIGDAGEMSLQEALRLALSLEPGGQAGGLPVTEVVADGWISELMQQLAGGAKMQDVPTPSEFKGTLRPYQSTGLAWLAFLRQWGLGACLADDMGLGKTIQVIALLLAERAAQHEHRPALLICPTSVVGNWQHELARFAPDLRVLAHHGTGRKKVTLADQAAQHDVVISSYALLHRDEKHLSGVEWGDVILDEAQNIKNPSTKQAQAARKLPAQWRVALTGTPVENRLSELWSIFQFLNPGYLGSQKDFQERLAKPIERMNDPAAAKKLKSLVGPFILRRVKTDPNVISDLPDKNEIKVYCNLTKEQATLYEAVVRDSVKRIAEAEGTFGRRGIILATLMKLKQVCNHPAQFLGDGSALPSRSGKLARLTEMLDEVRAVRERTLVFTQFAEMGGLLKGYLQETFGDEVLFLYGSTPPRSRDKMVERFQNDSSGPLVFILSIKAGGTGLNLMRANHVFHFDRWWNPAVENQATDRAFRIGQTRNVQVYKYLCAGTFEEKIDDMIERKKALAESIVGTSEGWLTELSTDQLRDLFTLRKEAVGDE